MPPYAWATYSTGVPRFGRMSARIRWSARSDVAPAPRTSMSTVIGRRRAVRMSHMVFWLLPIWSGSGLRSAHLIQKWLDVAAQDRVGQECAPDRQVRDGVLGLGLGEQSLRFGN